MYYISKSAATSSLVCTLVRDLPFTDLTQYYAFVLFDINNQQDHIIMTQDRSDVVNNFQHFIITGSTIQLALGNYNYKLYSASGSTESDIDYSTILQPGTIKITS